MTATLTEITALSWSRPAPSAPAVVCAAWYDRKAGVLHDMADDARSASEQDTYRQWAADAHEHAVQLIAAGIAAGSAGGGVR